MSPPTAPCGNVIKANYNNYYIIVNYGAHAHNGYLRKEREISVDGSRMQAAAYYVALVKSPWGPNILLSYRAIYMYFIQPGSIDHEYQGGVE